jgi:hypothetical protein
MEHPCHNPGTLKLWGIYKTLIWYSPKNVENVPHLPRYQNKLTSVFCPALTVKPSGPFSSRSDEKPYPLSRLGAGGCDEAGLFVYLPGIFLSGPRF